MRVWKFPKLVTLNKLRKNYPNESANSVGNGVSSETESKKKSMKRTCGFKAMREMKSLVSRTLRSTITSCSTKCKKVHRVPEVPDASENNIESFMRNDPSEDSTFQLRRPNNCSSLYPFGTESNFETTIVNCDTTYEKSTGTRNSDLIKLAETTVNSRNSIFSLGKSKILDGINNGSSTPSSYINNSVRKSDPNFSQTPIKIPLCSSKIESSHFTQTPTASASSYIEMDPDLTLSPIVAGQNCSAHTSIYFKFNDRPEAKAANSDIPFISSNQYYNIIRENRTVNDDQVSDPIFIVNRNVHVQSPVTHRRGPQPNEINNPSRTISRPPRSSQPGRCVSKDRRSFQFPEISDSQSSVPGTSSTLPVSDNGDHPPALPPKFRKCKSSCTYMQFPNAFPDFGYKTLEKPISFPTIPRTDKKKNIPKLPKEHEYCEIPEFIRSPILSTPQQTTSNTGEAVSIAQEPPPPLPPRCPGMVQPSRARQWNKRTFTLPKVDCPPPLPPRSPTIRLSEEIDDKTRAKLRDLALFAMTSSQEKSKRSRPNALTITTSHGDCPPPDLPPRSPVIVLPQDLNVDSALTRRDTSPNSPNSLEDFSTSEVIHGTITRQATKVGRTVATQTIDSYLATQTTPFSTTNVSSFPTINVSSFVHEVAVTRSENLRGSPIYLPMNVYKN